MILKTIMAFTIEKNVPLRKGRVGNGRPSIYRDAIKALKVGDSFLVPKMRTMSVVATVSRWGLILGVELTCRTEGTGVRVWRTK